MLTMKRELEKADCPDCKNCSSYFWGANDRNNSFIHSTHICFAMLYARYDMQRILHTLLSRRSSHFSEKTNNSNMA